MTPETNQSSFSGQLQNVTLNPLVIQMYLVSKQDYDWLQQSVLTKTQRIAELERINVNLEVKIDRLQYEHHQLEKIIEKNREKIGALETSNDELKKVQMRKIEKQLENVDLSDEER